MAPGSTAPPDLRYEEKPSCDPSTAPCSGLHETSYFWDFTLGLPDLANKNAGCPVEFEFQINK